MTHQYKYLDSDEDRRTLVEDIRQTRLEVLRLVDRVPKEQWYEPRYHGWSLAAMLGHLQMMDRLTLWLIQLGVLGIRLPISTGLMDGFNNTTSRLFQKRIVEASLKGLEKTEQQLADFVMTLPTSKFSRSVYDPALKQYLTVEQAMQEFFLYHWQEHLQTIRMVDDIRYEPPASNLV